MRKRLLIASLLLSILNANAKELTISNVKAEILVNNIKFPEIVLRQAIEETGWLKCTKCSRDKNNLFGLTKRTYVNGVKVTSFQSFKTWEESVLAYKKWQDKWYKGGDYYDFLNCIYKGRKGDCKRYATSKTYTSDLRSLRINYDLY